MFSIVHMARTFIGFASVTAAAAVGAAIVRALDAARDRLRATVAPRAAVDDAAA
jgi:TRAP-type mannitol/chloroaromatic compound transport system permease large subunit